MLMSLFSYPAIVVLSSQYPVCVEGNAREQDQSRPLFVTDAPQNQFANFATRFDEVSCRKCRQALCAGLYVASQLGIREKYHEQLLLLVADLLLNLFAP